MLAGRPTNDVAVPHVVRRLAAGRDIRVVWQNALGGLTFELGTGPAHVFVKWAPAGSGLDLEAEAVRMEWASRYTPVPRPLDRGAGPEGSWLVTEAVAGETTVADRWKANTAVAVAAIGEGLRAFHDALPVGDCPFSWSAGERLDDARRRAEAGLLDRSDWHPEHRHLNVEQAVELLFDVPEVDRAVVCHGDACAPNTLVGSDGRWVGHVDLGHLGVADRWADLAVATWSTAWNFGLGWEPTLLAAYGAEADPERTAYYRLLWDLGP